MFDVKGKVICPGSDYVRKVGDIQDLVGNMLFKFPVKDLLKCKTVAKLWKDLIGEHYFHKLHFKNSRKNPKLIAYVYKEAPEPGTRLHLTEESGCSMPLVGFPGFVHDISSLELISSFHGLLCCTGMVEEELIIWICNLSSQKYHVLPVGTPSVTTPSVSVIFGSEKHTYKVLHLFGDTQKSKGYCNKCEIYTPDTEAWTTIGDGPCLVTNDTNHGCPTHVNADGRIYMLVWLQQGEHWIPTCVDSIDMEGQFTSVDLRELIMGKFASFAALLEYENRLLLITVDDTVENLLIWSLHDHHQSTWSRPRRVSHGMSELGLQDISSIGAVKNELLFLMKPNGAQCFHYRMLNLEKMIWRELQVSSELRQDTPFVLPFIESLFKCKIVISK